jgi:hypothetical protein
MRKSPTRARPGVAPMRGIMKKAAGGKVEGFSKEKSNPSNLVYDGDADTIGDQGNSAELRTKNISEFDKDHGGKGPLRPGFAAGGLNRFIPPVAARQAAMAAPNRMAPAAQPALGMSGPARMGLGNVPRVGLPAAITNRAMMRATGGVVNRYATGGVVKKFKTGGTAPRFGTGGAAPRFDNGGKLTDKDVAKAKAAAPPTPPPPPPKKDDSMVGKTKGLFNKSQKAMEDLGLATGGVVKTFKRGGRR